MHLLKDRGFSLPSSDITAREVYHDRRRLLALLAGAAAGAAAPAAFAQDTRPKLPGVRSTVTGAQTMEKLTSLQDITSYNNFYEFGTDKADPGRNAHTLKTRPWTVAVEGEVKKPRVVDIDELHKLSPMEERVYRLRCVEGWSMVIPWMGYSLAELIKRVEPTGNAKYIEFVTLADPK